MEKTKNWLKEHINAGGTIVNRGDEVDFTINGITETIDRETLSLPIRRYIERFRKTVINLS